MLAYMLSAAQQPAVQITDSVPSSDIHEAIDKQGPAALHIHPNHT